MNIDEPHVYKMNDYEWWVSKWDKVRTNEWYLDFHGLAPDENPVDDVYEVDKDLEGMWVETLDIGDAAKFNNSKDIFSKYQRVSSSYDRKTRFGDLRIINGSFFKYIPFREAIEYEGDFLEPYMISTTDI